MKKKLLLFLPIAFLLCSCDNALTRLSIGNWKPFGFLADKEQEEEEPKDDGVHPGDVTPEDMKTHATSLTLTPSAPFQLKVGESKDLSVSLDNMSKIDDSEKKFEWSLSGDAVEYTLDEDSTRKATVVGVKSGSAQLTVTNTYNRNLSKAFKITVIDFNGENDYLWQFNNENKAPYYNDLSKFDKKEGRVNLRGIEWDYYREKGVKAHSGNGGLCFGLSGGNGSDPNPETRVTFEALNSRKVKSISIEASSTNSLSKMTVKVGDATFINNVTLEKPSGNVLSTYSSLSSITPAAGNILIDIETPEYSMSEAAADPYYKSPGNCCIKSIFISFEENPSYVTTKNYDFRAMYNDETDTVLHTLGTTAKEVNISDADFNIKIEKAKQSGTGEDDKIQGVALTNGFIEISLNKENEVFSMVEMQFEYGTSTSKNIFSLQTTRSGGSPFSNSQFYNDKDTGLLKTYVFPDNTNKIRLEPHNSFNVGLDSLKISTRTGVQATIKEVVAPVSFRADKMDYVTGEYFNPTGLPNVNLVFNEDSIRDDYLSPTDFEWFDGASYDSNPASATQTLQTGTTYVYGVFRNSYVVKVNGITVSDLQLNLTLVKNTSELNSSDHFYLIAKDADKLLMSSSGADMKNTSGFEQLNVESYSDNIGISAKYDNDYFVFNSSGEKFAIKATTAQFIGMTNTGGVSISQNPANKYFDISIDANTGVVTLKIEKSADSTYVRYLCFDSSEGKIALSESLVANFCIYKKA
ncbi:MAG: hypothetical protein IKP50_00950 [Bacilli bacterium]|nr:hypothetical protein [Bacilli bacterium]